MALCRRIPSTRCSNEYSVRNASVIGYRDKRWRPGEGPLVAAGLKQARIQLTLRPDSPQRRRLIKRYRKILRARYRTGTGTAYAIGEAPKRPKAGKRYRTTGVAGLAERGGALVYGVYDLRTGNKTCRRLPYVCHARLRRLLAIRPARPSAYLPPLRNAQAHPVASDPAAPPTRTRPCTDRPPRRGSERF